MSIGQRAVTYAVSVIRCSSDWQEVAQALMDHNEFGPWIEQQFGEDYVAPVTDIVRKAEERLGDDIPSGYSN